MRGKRAKGLRKQIFGNILDRLESRKYAAQMAVSPMVNSLVETGAIVAMGLRDLDKHSLSDSRGSSGLSWPKSLALVG